MSAHRKPMPRAYRWIRWFPPFTTPLGMVVMVLSLAVTHSTALFVLGAISAVSGWIAMALDGRTR